MVRYCCVPNCKGNHDKNHKISVFTFPTDLELQEKWKRAISGPDFKISKHSAVCEYHFKPQEVRRAITSTDIRTGHVVTIPLTTPRLIKNTVPSLFLNLIAEPQAEQRLRFQSKDISLALENFASEILTSDIDELIKKSEKEEEVWTPPVKIPRISIESFPATVSNLPKFLKFGETKTAPVKNDKQRNAEDTDENQKNAEDIDENQRKGEDIDMNQIKNETLVTTDKSNELFYTFEQFVTYLKRETPLNGWNYVIRKNSVAFVHFSDTFLPSVLMSAVVDNNLVLKLYIKGNMGLNQLGSQLYPRRINYMNDLKDTLDELKNIRKDVYNNPVNVVLENAQNVLTCLQDEFKDKRKIKISYIICE